MKIIKLIERSGIPDSYFPASRCTSQKLQLDVKLSIQQEQQSAAIPQQTEQLTTEELIEQMNFERTVFFMSRGML